MRKNLLGVSLMIFCGLVLAIAQAPPQESKDKAMTIAGCVQAGTEPNTFVVTNASAVPKTGANPSTPSELARTDSTYKLSGSVDLKAHVGHKVELTGTVEPKDAAAPASDKKSDWASFKVTAIKHVATSCP